MKKSLSRLSAILLSAVLLLKPISVLAYDGAKATNYSNTYANNNNISFRVFSSDCTNFVSQSLFYGGYSMVWGDENPFDNNNWYYDISYHNYATSWTVANEQVNFQILHSPGGYWGTTYDGDIGDYKYNDAQAGDVIVYSWGGNTYYDHLSLEAGTGTDSNSGWTGDLVNQHTTNRYHAYWTLQPYNSKYYSTQVKVLHISSNNY